MGAQEEALALATQVEQSLGQSPVPHELREAFGKASKALAAGDPRRPYLAWDENLFAYQLPVRAERDKEAGEFGPFFQAADGVRYPPRVGDLSGEVVAYFRLRLGSSANPSAKARLADFLWLRTREVVFADQAITEYAGAALSVLPSEFGEMTAVEYLARAMAIARALERDRQDLRAAIRKVGESIPEDRFGHLSYLITRIAGDVICDGELTTFLLEKMLAVADSAAGRGGQERSSERYALDAAIELARALRDPEQANLFRKRVAQSFEREADERTAEAPLIQAALLQDAVKHYANLGMREDLERAKTKLHVASQGAAANLKPLAVEMSIPTAELRAHVTALLEQGRQRAPWFHLQLMAVGNLWPSWADVAAQTAEHERRAPLTSLVRLTVLGPDGRPLPRPADSAAAREFDEVRRYMKDTQFRLGILGIEVEMLRDLQGWNEELILEALRAGAFFGDQIIETIAPGVRAYERGEHWLALHVLIPQIERVIREIARAVGVDTYRYMSSKGAIHWETLDQLLQEEPVREFLARLRPDLAQELECLLTDGRGLNLRHDVAHGILTPAQPVKDYALLSILILLTLSAFTVDVTPDDDGACEAPSRERPEGRA